MHIERKYLAILFTLTLSMTTLAIADEEGTFFGQDASGKWIVGLKAGVMQNGTDGFGDATNAGVVLGYRFDRAIGGIGASSSIELEFTTSVDDGDFSNVVGTWDVDTYALFFTYATPGTVYFQGQTGCHGDGCLIQRGRCCCERRQRLRLRGGVWCESRPTCKV